jgi:hypothetical protein
LLLGIFKKMTSGRKIFSFPPFIDETFAFCCL